MFFGQPKPPPQEILDEFKKVEDRRAELNSRIHNPFLDLLRSDGEAMLRDIISGLQSKGFEILSDTRKSNGEVDQQTIVLQKNIATIEVKPENSTLN